MKETGFIFVVIADQVASRTGADAVPDALKQVAALPCVLPFEGPAQPAVRRGTACAEFTTEIYEPEGSLCADRPSGPEVGRE